MNWFKRLLPNKSIEEKKKAYIKEPEQRTEFFYPKAVVPGFKMPTKGSYKYGHPEGAIVHFTAGHSKYGLQKALDTAQGGVNNGFCFFVIGSDGSVVQSFPINRWGYHAGKSGWKSLFGTVSDELVGIEICNAGKLTKKEDGTFVSWFGETYKENEVRYNDGSYNHEKGYYHAYTPEQEEALIKLLMWLKNRNPEVFKFDLVLGHDEVAPDRKNDPGASLSMPMPLFRLKLKSLYNQIKNPA